MKERKVQPRKLLPPAELENLTVAQFEKRMGLQYGYMRNPDGTKPDDNLPILKLYELLTQSIEQDLRERKAKLAVQ